MSDTYMALTRQRLQPAEPSFRLTTRKRVHHVELKAGEARLVCSASQAYELAVRMARYASKCAELEASRVEIEARYTALEKLDAELTDLLSDNLLHQEPTAF